MKDTSHPAYGIWEVWNGLPPEYDDLTPEEIEEEYDLLGVFKGFVDDIAFHLVDKHQDRYPFYFRALETFEDCVTVASAPSMTKSPYCEIIVETPAFNWLSRNPQPLLALFEARPVTADALHDQLGYTRSIRLSQHVSTEGQQHAQRKASLERILTKLTKGEVQTLVEHGLTPYTY